REQPAAPVGLHDERIVAGKSCGAALLGVPAVVGVLLRREVGDILPGPPLVLVVPPDIPLAFAPGLAVGVGGGTVVEDPPVGRPRPRPLGGRAVLFAARLAAGGLVDPVRIDAGVDPAAPGGGA